MIPVLHFTSHIVSPPDIFALAGTGVGCKNFYETLFARAAAALQQQKFAVCYPHQGPHCTINYYNTKYSEEPRVKFCKVNSFVTGSYETFPWRGAENTQFQSHDLKKKSMLSWDSGHCCKPFILMLLPLMEERTRNQGRADTFYITSIQIPSLQRWQQGDIACNAHIKCQGNQCFAFWLFWLQIHLIMALVMSRSAAWGELVHIKEYLVISRIEHSTNVKLFLLWASEIPAKYFSIFDYSRLEREVCFGWPQSVWLIARIIYTLNPDRPKGPWTGGFLFWHISKNQDEYLPSRHNPPWLAG